MAAFEALFTDYNMRVTNETDFYAGIFMLLSRTGSRHLLPALTEVLPASWQAEDLSWLHQAAEAQYEDRARVKNASSDVVKAVPSIAQGIAASDEMENPSAGAVDHVGPVYENQSSSTASETRPPTKRAKKRPANGFRTSFHSGTRRELPMFVDPAELMIHQPVIDDMPDSEEEIDNSMTEMQPMRKGLVKLKLQGTKSKAAAARRGSRAKAAKKPKVKESLLRKTTSVDDDIDESVDSLTANNTTNNTTPQPAVPRKGRARYGELFAAEIEHFGHFPTRRAVIARSSRPYVHLSCGKGFGHPMDLKDHHRNKERTNNGNGCPGKDGIPQGEDDTWDAHPSARVEYPNLNYAKVRDGYVLLDQKSRDLIDNAVAAGLQYLAERESLGRGSVSDEEEDEDVDMEMEEDEETKTAKETIDTEMHDDQSLIRSTKLGLRRRSTKASK